MFKWLRTRWLDARTPLDTEWIVSIVDSSISATDHTGATKAILISEVERVVIETNDTGPIGTDLWWLVFNAAGQLGTAFPNDAKGCGELAAVLSAWVGFDAGELLKAMCSTSNAVFEVYRRPPPHNPADFPLL